MKTQKPTIKHKRNKLRKGCTYCGFFKPCGQCEAESKRQAEIINNHSLR